MQATSETHATRPLEAMAADSADVPEGDGSPKGWRSAFEMAGRPVPPAPAAWPFFQASPTARVRLLDALNLTIERRNKAGRWVKVSDGVYARSMADAMVSLRRRGMLPSGADVPTDARRWPYEVTP